MSSAADDPVGLGFNYTLRQLSQHCWAFVDRFGLSNVGVVAGDAGPIIIDSTLHPFYASRIAAAIHATFGRPFLVINTHFHLDHMLGNSEFDPACGYLWHTHTAALVGRHYATMLTERPNLRPAALPPAVAATWSGEAVSIDRYAPHVRLTRVGGHSPDLVTVSVPDDGVCFASDLWFNGCAPFFGRWSCASGHGCVRTWARELRSLGRTSHTIVIPGHGPPGSPDAISAQARTFETFIQAVDGLRESGTPPHAAWAGIMRDDAFPIPYVDAQGHLECFHSLWQESVGRSWDRL